MTHQPRHMKLGAFLYPTGHHVAAWRHPESDADAGINIRHYQRLAATAERGLFDLIFLADGVGVRGEELAALSRTAVRYVGQFEPLTLLSALSAVTSRVGLVATVSTTYDAPFHIARRFASLDHLSGGRAGWNVVTSADDHEAMNFGLDGQIPPAIRYARAEEAVDVVAALWDSWDDDAFHRDKESGIYFDPRGYHVTGHRGEFFKVRGPLNVPRSPQGRPLIVQAGSSEPGRALAARTADAVFTATQTVEEGRAYYADIKRRMPNYGRDPSELLVMPGVFPVVAPTRAEAEDRFADLQSLIHPAVAVDYLSQHVGADLSAYDIDGPMPDLPPTTFMKSRRDVLVARARRDDLTIRELALSMAGARGHWQIVGTARDIADALQERFEGGAADGFNVMAPILPADLTRFVDLVIPELQRRGLFRTAYEGPTLRHQLGIARPERGHWTARRTARPIAAE
ncbi:LLM class flavin-dependent oxidoreductase [Acuticoccus sp. M5D2P5]|uniref:LLM class flavin-dependent oxidoreductase n=1 Tax=Acuticoccus kalidii TaxID=2910977 RepID=UPI001F1AFF00|nr:LLM class flavin-dependent oxidoreductase [Acuticoccus kalidii]MCF3934009.1 LLM class flavin-dependent oxidoreductase [Acuticoccus kalidii]